MRPWEGIAGLSLGLTLLIVAMSAGVASTGGDRPEQRSADVRATAREDANVGTSRGPLRRAQGAGAAHDRLPVTGSRGGDRRDDGGAARKPAGGRTRAAGRQADPVRADVGKALDDAAAATFAPPTTAARERGKEVIGRVPRRTKTAEVAREARADRAEARYACEREVRSPDDIRVRCEPLEPDDPRYGSARPLEEQTAGATRVDVED